MIEDGAQINHYKYQGQGVSTNDYYNSGGWWKRNKLKNDYKPIIVDLIKDSLLGKKLDQFGLIIFFNSRHDTDNVIGFGKIFVDVLKDELDILVEDNRHKYKLCACVPDLTLPMNTFEFIVIDYGDNEERNN